MEDGKKVACASCIVHPEKERLVSELRPAAEELEGNYTYLYVSATAAIVVVLVDILTLRNRGARDKSDG
jgi:hypothetical protein